MPFAIRIHPSSIRLAMDPQESPAERPPHSPPAPEVPPKGLFFVASDLDVESEAFAAPSNGSEDWQSYDEPEHCEDGVRGDEFLDLEELQFLSIEGVDKQRRKILRIVGKFLPASVVDSSRLKDYVLQKISKELGEEQFCVVYFHTRVRRKENSPGVFTLRWIYETLPQEYRQRLEVVYFLHPGLLSRTFLGTIGRFFLSDGLYRKVNYVNRVEFLWDHIKKGQLEVPEFVYEHDEELEHRPLMDYGLETDPLHLYGMPGLETRQAVRWAP